MEDAPVLFKVVKMEDGTVEAVSISNNERTTQIYQPYMTHNISETDQVYCPTVTPVSSTSNSDFYARFAYIWEGLYTIFCYTSQYILYLALLIVFLWPANPNYITPIPRYRKGQIIPQSLIVPKPADFRRGCNDGLACLLSKISPIFNTSFGAIYPNYTTADGKPVDYGRALTVAMGVLLNSSCHNYELHTTHNETYSSRNESEFQLLFEYMLYDIKGDLFLLQHNCQYEAALLVRDPLSFSLFDIELDDHVQLPPITECQPPWEDIFNTPYTPKPPPKPCVPQYSSYSKFMDFAYLVDFQ